jgi:hypothetical protein
VKSMSLEDVRAVKGPQLGDRNRDDSRFHDPFCPKLELRRRFVTYWGAAESAAE